jgi:hypothetical protein
VSHTSTLSAHHPPWLFVQKNVLHENVPLANVVLFRSADLEAPSVMEDLPGASDRQITDQAHREKTFARHF